MALHGGWGENGVVQAILESQGQSYTGSGSGASAIGMDKLVSKQVASSLGIEVPKLTKKLPMVVKPQSSGSSLGVKIVRNRQEMPEMNGGKWLLEEYIQGVEVSCGVFGNRNPRALPVIEIRPKNRFFDYEAKYVAGKSVEVCPALIPKAVAKKIQEQAVKFYQTIGARGYVRLDFIIRDNVPYFLEINTLPGMTETSLLPQEARAVGISYSKLLEIIIKLAEEK